MHEGQKRKTPTFTFGTIPPSLKGETFRLLVKIPNSMLQNGELLTPIFSSFDSLFRCRGGGRRGETCSYVYVFTYVCVCNCCSEDETYLLYVRRRLSDEEVRSSDPHIYD